MYVFRAVTYVCLLPVLKNQAGTKASTFLTVTGQELLRGVPVDRLNTHNPFSNMEEPVSSVLH